jgi:hypothetical protein
MEGEEQQKRSDICKEEPFAKQGEEEVEEKEDTKECKRDPWSVDPFDSLVFEPEWVTPEPFAENDYEYVLMRRNRFPGLIEKLP